MAGGKGAGEAKGKGKGRNGCHDLFCGETMVWVWFVILAMALCSFIIVGITGRGRVDLADEGGIGGGPWWAWMIGVALLLFVFVVLYMMSLQYAAPVLQYKLSREDDPEAGVQLTKHVEKVAH